MKFGIDFGAFSDKIVEQLEQQGLKYTSDDSIDHFQKDADAIVRLSVRGILSDSEKDKARKRLMKDISRVVTKGSHHG